VLSLARVPTAASVTNVPSAPRSALPPVSSRPADLGPPPHVSGAAPGEAAPTPGYAILFMDGVVERRGRSGLSHAEAMSDAEELQRKGKTARVMHVLGSRSYEVDRYPPR
jgi:hypothetical protein